MSDHPGYYESLDFNSPMTEATAQRVVARLSGDGPGQPTPVRSIVDVGCGWGELLLRLVSALPQARGHGIDQDPRLIERARRNADRRGLAERVRFSTEAIRAAEPSRADTTDAVAPEPADLVLCVGSEHAFGTLDQALQALHSLVHPGGRLLLGTMVWDRPPSSALLDDFGPLPTVEELVADTAQRGWRPLDLTTASLADWDHFEFGFLADWEQVVSSEEADTDQRAESRRAADTHRNHYLSRRGILGFAYLTLGLPLA